MIFGVDIFLDYYFRVFMNNKKKLIILYCIWMLFLESSEVVFLFKLNLEMMCCKFFLVIFLWCFNGEIKWIMIWSDFYVRIIFFDILLNW